MNTRALGLWAAGCGLVSFLAAISVVALSIVGGEAPLRGNAAGLITLALMVVPFMAAMVFIALYVYSDAESRGMPGALWGLLIFLFASLPGFLIYLLMRRPRLNLCPSCSTPIREDYVVCPRCRASVATACHGCGRRVEPTWSICPYCQTALKNSQEHTPART